MLMSMLIDDVVDDVDYIFDGDIIVIVSSSYSLFCCKYKYVIRMRINYDNSVLIGYCQNIFLYQREKD